MPHQFTTTPEWRIFKAVQPLFAATLPWKLVDPERCNSEAATAAGVDIEAMQTTFQLEMRFLILNVSEHDLSPRSFDSCINELEKLLQFLESLVLSSVILSEGKLKKRPGEKDIDRHAPPQKAPRTVINIQTWLGRSPTECRLAPQPPKASEQTDPRILPTPESNEVPPSISSYEKLEALATMIANSSHQSDSLQDYYRFLKLQHTFQDFKEGKAHAFRLNKLLQGLKKVPGRTSFQTMTAQTVSATKWKSNTPWDMLERLFRILLNSTCDKHEARIRLNGFRLDECSYSSPPLDMFMSSCPTHTYWQDCRCTSTSSNPTTLSSQDGSVALSDICQYIQGSIDSNPPKLLSVEFDDKLLLFWPDRNHTSVYGSDFTMISFKDLLDQGYFREPSGTFDMSDKAVLALSLAKCMLHLVQGPWLREPWTGSGIQFLGRINKQGRIDYIYDIWHPYVTCQISPDSRHREFAPADVVPFLQSFARLLVELDTGESVQSDPASPTFEDDIAAIQEEKMDGFGREYYLQAVEGCFRVNGVLLQYIEEIQLSKDKLGITSESRYLVRKAIYDEVVLSLERNFSQIPRRDRTTILSNVNQGKGTTSFNTPLPRHLNNIMRATINPKVANTGLPVDSSSAVGSSLPTERPCNTITNSSSGRQFNGLQGGQNNNTGGGTQLTNNDCLIFFS